MPADSVEELELPELLKKKLELNDLGRLDDLCSRTWMDLRKKNGFPEGELEIIMSALKKVDRQLAPPS